MEEFKIQKIDSLFPLIHELNAEIKSLYAKFFKIMNFKHDPIVSDEDIYRFYQQHKETQHTGIKILRNSVSLLKLTAHQPLWETIKKSWGLQNPILEAQPILRCDLPNESQLRFLRHQDYPYNLGSVNSLTIWIPLQSVDHELGCLRVAPGSSEKNYPHQDGLIDPEINFDWKELPMQVGEVLSFSQRLVHESGTNNSKNFKIRFTAILRVSDYGHSSYTIKNY